MSGSRRLDGASWAASVAEADDLNDLMADGRTTSITLLYGRQSDEQRPETLRLLAAAVDDGIPKSLGFENARVYAGPLVRTSGG